MKFIIGALEALMFWDFGLYITEMEINPQKNITNLLKNASNEVNLLGINNFPT
jgi:hypothetical protein